jgi:hypothetical protein
VGFRQSVFDLAQNPVVFNWKCQKHYRHADKSNQTGETSMTTSNTIDFNTFAFNIGEQSRLTRDASKPLSISYHKGTPEQQKDLRTRWMLNHLRGALKVNAKVAERILSEGKGAGAKPDNIKAIDKASSDFRYHIVRPEAKTTQPAKPAHNRISVVHREAAMAFLGEFEGETLAEQIKQAVALLNALK